MANFFERLCAVNELAAFGLIDANPNFFAKLGDAKSFQVFPFFEQPQPFTHHFALRLVKARLKKISDEFIECGAQIDVHI